MPAIVVAALVLGAVVVALRGSPFASGVVLVATWLLVPGGAPVPGLEGSPLFIHRLMVVAVLAGFVWQVVTGRMARALFAPRGIHIAFLAYLTVATVVGVVLAPPGARPSQNFDPWLDIVGQAAFFVAALAVFRACGALRSVRIIATVATVLAAVALSERAFGWSYARWFSTGLVDPDSLLAIPLEQRGPYERVRASATFALEYGWMAALIAPVTLAAALMWRRNRLAWVTPGLLVVSIVWSVSRSAYVGLALGVFVTVIGVVLDRPRQLAVITLGALVFAAALMQGPIQEAIDVSSVAGESDVRFGRLPEVLAPVADRPFLGLGLGGLLARDVAVVDVGWVLTYATLGVIGLLSVGALLLTAIHTSSRFLRAGPDDRRIVAAAATGSLIAVVPALLAYDFGTLRASTETLWAMAALGIVANEEMGVLRAPGRRLRLPSWGAVAVASTGAAAGSMLGVLLVLSTPVRSSTTLVSTTVDPVMAAAAIDQGFTVKVLSQTACTVLHDMPTTGVLRCQDLDQLAGGISVVRIEARDAAEVERIAHAVTERLVDVFPVATVQVRDRGSGRPSWALTGPLWMSAIGAVGGLILVNRTADGRGRRRGGGTAPSSVHAGSRRPTPDG